MGEWQLDLHGGTDRVAPADLDRTRVPVRDRLRDRQPQPGTGTLVALRPGGAEEPVEDGDDLVLGDADPGVRDGDPYRVRDRVQPDRDPTAGRGELQRVAQDVADHPDQI